MRRKAKLISPVQVVDIADRGKAIAKDNEGHVYLLEKTVPGDIVSVMYTRKKKGMRVGKIMEYLQYSNQRIEPFCQHFGLCGGCKWQYLSYTAQLSYKENLVKSAIQRIAKEDIQKLEPIFACEDTRYYRNKMEFSFSNSRWLTEAEIASDETFEDQRVLGFHAPGSFSKIVPIEHCHLQDDFHNKIRNHIRDYALRNDLSFYDYKTKKGLLRNLILRNNLVGNWMLILSFNGGKKQVREAMLDDLASHFPEISSMHYVINQKANDTLYDQDIICYHGKDHIVEKLGGISYKINPKSFFQTNTKQAKNLYDTVVKYAALEGDENVYDLYTGLGSIALYIADKCRHVVGIEEVEAAIDGAKENMVLNNIENASFYASDVKLMLNESFVKMHGSPDIIITDPPRVGMHKDVVHTLNQIKVPKLVYVSCNPATQARDIAMLSESYELVKAVPVDMFPHTHHIETVALLKSKN